MPDVLEQYEFTFAYGANGQTTMHTKGLNAGGTAPVSTSIMGGPALMSAAAMKRQATSVIRALVTGVSTLDGVPESRALSMHVRPPPAPSRERESLPSIRV